MLGFKDFLKEEFLIEGSSENDDKGKMFELLFQKHMHHKKQLPNAFRSNAKGEHGGTPKEVHDKLAKKMGKEKYDEVNRHAQKAAEHVKKTVLKGHTVHDVHWTSNRDTEKSAGDHEKLTGVKDTNQKADTIITTHHKGKKHHIPISLKYGHHEPNVDNPGAKELEKEAGHKAGTYSKIWSKHDKDMESLGYKGTKAERHAKFKQHRDVLEKEKAAHKAKDAKPADFKPKSLAAKTAHAAYTSAQTAKKKIARMHEKGLANKSDKELRKTIHDAANPPTHHETYLVHAQTDKKGGEPTIHAGKASDKIHNHLNNYKNLKVRKGNGGNVDIVGTHKHTGEEHVVASRGIKMGNGPHKGFNGTFKLGARASSDKDED